MTASSQIIFALRAASPKYTTMIQPTFGWLLRLAIQQRHQNSRPHRPLNFLFFLSLHSPPETMGERPPPRIPPVLIASPVPPPPPTPSIGWLLHISTKRQPPKTGAPPVSYFSMGAISASKTWGPNAAGTRPAAGRLHQAHHGEPRRRDSGPWRMLPWRLMGKPLGVGRCSDCSSCGV